MDTMINKVDKIKTYAELINAVCDCSIALGGQLPRRYVNIPELLEDLESHDCKNKIHEELFNEIWFQNESGIWDCELSTVVLNTITRLIQMNPGFVSV